MLFNTRNSTLAMKEKLDNTKDLSQWREYTKKFDIFEQPSCNFRDWTFHTDYRQKYIYYANDSRTSLCDVKKDFDGAVDLSEKYDAYNIKIFGECTKQAVIDQATTYKIHLQINQKYLFDFVRALLVELDKPIFENIGQFKFTYKFTPDRHELKAHGGQALPIIVLYVTPLKSLLDLKKRDYILDSIISEIIKLVTKFCTQKPNKIKIQDLAWPVIPRFNKKIIDGIYIAGGDADRKNSNGSTIAWIPYNGIVKYSNDLCFVYGYEYNADMSRILDKAYRAVRQDESITTSQNQIIL